ncbi:D-Ala-D-Ala carboxypeptidase family metallohydrolase [Aquimarina agarivorans]|uniref:D-Ala-D-Ala carboxypeptidase family metallohydrolase n=1 Tax=Aquimarina agarivorans TaxID=980584 RepID=UPI000248FC61|nr:D-Ala-D-Ala carboxypeptidase family metallohydrolase [Aquimarina agarivorans]
MNLKSNTHIYVGASTLVLVLGSAFFVYRLLVKKKQKQLVVKPINTAVFDSPDVRGSGKCIDPLLVYRLQLLAQKSGYPIFSWISSGVRTPYWNRKVGGVRNSSHEIPNCKAVDIKALNKTIRNRLVFIAREVGFKRIGVGKTFVHLDIDTNKSQNVAWGYPSGSRPEINPFV